MTSCSRPTRLDSDEFSTTRERIEILKKEVVCVTAIHDAEFELFNVNGFGDSNGLSVPGASSSDYRFVVRVDTSDISKWREGFTHVDPSDANDNWTRDIIKNRKETWSTSSKPAYYVRQDLPDGWSTTMIVYSSEGILFKRVIMN